MSKDKKWIIGICVAVAILFIFQAFDFYNWHVNNLNIKEVVNILKIQEEVLEVHEKRLDDHEKRIEDLESCVYSSSVVVSVISINQSSNNYYYNYNLSVD